MVSSIARDCEMGGESGFLNHRRGISADPYGTTHLEMMIGIQGKLAGVLGNGSAVGDALAVVLAAVLEVGRLEATNGRRFELYSSGDGTHPRIFQRELGMGHNSVIGTSGCGQGTAEILPVPGAPETFPMKIRIVRQCGG